MHVCCSEIQFVELNLNGKGGWILQQQYQHKKSHNNKKISLEKVTTLRGQKKVDHFKITTLGGQKRNMTILKNLHQRARTQRPKYEER